MIDHNNMSKSAKILFILGFISSILAYSFATEINKLLYFMMQDNCNNVTGVCNPDGLVDYSSYYKLIAFTFACYTYVIYDLVRNKWSLFSFIVFLTALNSLADELFFNPVKIETNEYLGFMLTIILTHLFKDKWEKNS